MRLALVALLVSALAIIPAASAAKNPYRFSNRAGFERFAATSFVTLARQTLHKRYVVRSIGCAKTASGRGDCVVAAFNARDGLARFAYSLICASDAGNDCTGRINSWPSP
jgi:hypothetical protein